MKTRRQASVMVWTALLALVVLPGLARAQDISVGVGNLIPVTNVLGQTWTGSNDDPDRSCRVEIRQTWTGGMVMAPSNGAEQVNTFNPLITNSYLGHSVPVPAVNPGTFSEGFNDRSVFQTNRQYYVRVFSRPNPEEAVYYADTPPFFGPPEGVPNVNPEFGPPARVDGEEDVDTDGDGIPDALEDSEFSTSPSEWDSDLDGYSDWFEAYYLGYMNPLSEPANKEAPIELAIQAPQLETDPHVVSWWTLPVPGLTYRLDYRPSWSDDAAFSNVWEGAANSNSYQEVPVDERVPPDEPQGFFRVTVPYEGP